MAKQALLLCAVLAIQPALALAADSDGWTPVNRPAQTVTGRVVVTADRITFQSGKHLDVAIGVQMLFRPEKKKKKVMADLYRVLQPQDLALENGNKFCAGKNAMYLIVWKSEKVGNEADPRTMAVFSGQRFDAGSPDECGRYTYDAAGR